MRCRIHRGCHEIGGNCVEIESRGKRIVLDVGLPLSGAADVSLPEISGLSSADESLLGIFISHPHPDHYGLLEKIVQPAPVYIGEASRRIIEVSSFFTPLPPLGGAQPLKLVDRRPICVGPFTITPYRIDHSAHDSYCLLVEADGKRLFYSGDLRGHGRQSHLFAELLRHPPADIDVLICEGTQLGRTPDHAYPDEQSVADGMAKVFGNTSGLALVWCSSQNIDRLASVWDACQRSKRQLILDMYTAEIIRAATDDALPQPDGKRVFVFLPLSQKARIKAEKAFHIARPYYPQRIYPERLRDAASRSVMIFRPSMLKDLRRANCLDGTSLITSIWSGYLSRNRPELDKLCALGIQQTHIHTSGHATVDELRQFIEAIAAKRVVPIHLADREGFARLSGQVELKNDHEWWEV